MAINTHKNLRPDTKSIVECILCINFYVYLICAVYQHVGAPPALIPDFSQKSRLRAGNKHWRFIDNLCFFEMEKLSQNFNLHLHLILLKEFYSRFRENYMPELPKKQSKFQGLDLLGMQEACTFIKVLAYVFETELNVHVVCLQCWLY